MSKDFKEAMVVVAIFAALILGGMIKEVSITGECFRTKHFVTYKKKLMECNMKEIE